MNYRTMFSINALIATLLGLGFLILPGRILDRFGVDEAETKLISQFFGTAMLALGLLLWFAKDVAEADLQKGMGIALLIGAAAGLIAPVLGANSDTLLPTWGRGMLVYAFLAVANAYMVVHKPKKLTQA